MGPTNLITISPAGMRLPAANQRIKAKHMSVECLTSLVITCHGGYWDLDRLLETLSVSKTLSMGAYRHSFILENCRIASLSYHRCSLPSLSSNCRMEDNSILARAHRANPTRIEANLIALRVTSMEWDRENAKMGATISASRSGAKIFQGKARGWTTSHKIQWRITTSSVITYHACCA